MFIRNSLNVFLNCFIVVCVPIETIETREGYLNTTLCIGSIKTK